MPTKEEVLELLRTVEDPELGMDVVDLGLVYEVEVEGPKVKIIYSLTSMGCPAGPLIAGDMDARRARGRRGRGGRARAGVRPAVDAGQDVRRREVHPRFRLAVPDYTWAVTIPGEDIPHPLTTDYLVSEGEEIEIDGSEWLVENVERWRTRTSSPGSSPSFLRADVQERHGAVPAGA